MNRQQYMMGWIPKKPKEKDQLPKDIATGHMYYILEGRRVVPSTMQEWGKLLEDIDSRRIGEDIIGESRVSTVFLGMDHSFGSGYPVLFETMVFGGEYDQEQWRCSTYAQAEKQHKKLVKLLRAK